MANITMTGGIVLSVMVDGTTKAAQSSTGTVNVIPALGGGFTTGLSGGIDLSLDMDGGQPAGGVIGSVNLAPGVGGLFAWTWQPGVALSAKVQGAPRRDVPITGGVAVTMALGGDIERAAEEIEGGVDLAPSLGGTLARAFSGAGPGLITNVFLGGRIRTVRPSTGTGGEDRRAALGYRPNIPLLVRSIDAASIAEVAAANVSDGGRFLVAADYSEGDEVTWDGAGAMAGAIGQYVEPAIGDPYYVFLQPKPYEVVWYTPLTGDGVPSDGGMYRIEDGAWMPYRSFPERAVLSQWAIEILDPDGALGYLTRLLGAAHTQWTRDATDLSFLLDSRSCPDRFLTQLAKQWNLRLRTSDPAMQRRRLRGVVPRHRAKGLPSLVTTTLRELGYDGYPMEVWVDPTHADNWLDPTGAPAAVQAEIAARGLVIDPTNGEKGTAWIPKFHGWSPDLPDTYWPASRVGIHLTTATGASLPLNMPESAFDEVRQMLAEELIRDTLPAHVDIRYFATDVSPDAGDSIGVTDELAFVDFGTGATYTLGGFGMAATGSITFTGQPDDGDTVTIDDGTTTVTFEFDTGDGVTPGNVAVLIGATTQDTADNLEAAIDSSALDVDAVDATVTDPRVGIIHGSIGVGGNETITTDSGAVTVTGMQFGSGDIGDESVRRVLFEPEIDGRFDEDYAIEGEVPVVWTTGGTAYAAQRITGGVNVTTTMGGVIGMSMGGGVVLGVDVGGTFALVPGVDPVLVLSMVLGGHETVDPADDVAASYVLSGGVALGMDVQGGTPSLIGVDSPAIVLSLNPGVKFTTSVTGVEVGMVLGGQITVNRAVTGGSTSSMALGGGVGGADTMTGSIILSPVLGVVWIRDTIEGGIAPSMVIGGGFFWTQTGAIVLSPQVIGSVVVPDEELWAAFITLGPAVVGGIPGGYVVAGDISPTMVLGGTLNVQRIL